MKTKHYCFAIFLFMAISHLCFAQAYTLTVKNDLKETDKIPRYNLFYLSKLLADKNLSLEEKNKAFYALKNIINDSTLDIESKEYKIDRLKYKRIFDFLQTLKDKNKEQFDNWLGQNNTKYFSDFLTNEIDGKSLLNDLNTITKLKKEFDNQSSNVQKIETLNIDTEQQYRDSDLKNLILKFSPNEKDFENIFNKYYKKEHNNIIKSLESLKAELANNEANGNIKENINSLKDKYSKDDFNKLPEKLILIIDNYYFKDDKDFYYFRNLETLKKELNAEISKLRTLNISKEQELKEKIRIFSENFLTFFLTKNKDIESNEIKKILNTSNFSVSKDQQIIINSQIQTAQAQTGISGISIPSQSQMIEAMAIFLAKRAKQEAAIWFMDQIRLKMNNPMILDVFPETIKVIDGVENYKVPTFNTTWKYAIAKDFVEMPRNLVNSPWVKEVLIKDTKNHAMLKQSVDFGYDMNRLMTEQYNYRDIIKYFYINQRIEKDSKGNEIPNQEINRLIDNSTTLLYIVTNEFFAIENIDGKDVYRLLSYEEIASLDKDEIEVLLELIDLKYKERINNVNLIKNLNLAKKEEINKWIGNILISLSQLDKIRNDYQTKKEEIKNDLASKNFYNVWNVLNQMTKNLYKENLFNSTKMANLKTKIEWVQKGMSVYEHFQNNDYVGAANQTFELVNLITLNSADATITGNLHFEYAFGDNKKVSLNSITENEFVIKTYNGLVENDINVSFAKNNLVVKRGKEPEITIENYLILAKYIVSSTSKKRIKDFYNKENFENFEKILKLSQDLNIDETEMLQLINSIYMAKIANNINQNMAQVLISIGFTIKGKTDNTFKTSHHKYTKQLTNLLSFFGDVITVKDEHQLAGIIDSYALPPTSYKLKRKQPSSIDLNAYVGAFGGGLMSLKSTTIGSQPVYGITAPIGIAFTWSRNGWYDNYGFTVDVVDLGNVVNHYLVQPGKDYAKDVHFSEVFSLGTTFLMGIKNSPFVISGGFRFQPYNTGKDANNKVFDAGIFHLGVKIDIPLIHLSSKDF